VSSGVPPAIAGAECAPKPSMITHGSMDNELPIARWAIPLRDLWTKVNGCAPTTTPATAPCVAYGCPSEAPVHWCVENGGHGLSRGQAATIWAFFSKL
jgi:poly(3-hydroxybutyrate) depolymerase